MDVTLLMQPDQPRHFDPAKPASSAVRSGFRNITTQSLAEALGRPGCLYSPWLTSSWAFSSSGGVTLLDHLFGLKLRTDCHFPASAPGISGMVWRMIYCWSRFSPGVGLHGSSRFPKLRSAVGSQLPSKAKHPCMAVGFFVTGTCQPGFSTPAPGTLCQPPCLVGEKTSRGPAAQPPEPR